MSFATITKPSTYDDFLTYLKTEVKNQRGGKGLKINSVGKHAKNLKAFLNNCMRREIIPHTDLRFMKKLNIPAEKVNVNGGSIAMGHPLGATGAILIGTLIDELERRNLKRGLVTLCVGGGMGIATIIERV